VWKHTSFLVFVMKSKSQHWSFQSRNSKSHNKICLAVSNLCSKNLLWTNQIYTLSFPKKQLVRSQASKIFLYICIFFFSDHIQILLIFLNCVKFILMFRNNIPTFTLLVGIATRSTQEKTEFPTLPTSLITSYLRTY
jgi:hypothetical protein